MGFCSLVSDRILSVALTELMSLLEVEYVPVEAMPSANSYRYVYDLQLPPADSPDYVTPVPHDDEVESFQVCFAVGVGRS